MAEMSITATETTTTPLLTRRQAANSPSGRARATTSLAMLLGRFAGHRGASMLVREALALQVEQTRADWGYSFPSIAMEVVWNLVFVVFTVLMLLWTSREKPNVPLRVWICGYMLQRVTRTVFSWLEYRRRNRRAAEEQTAAGGGASVEDNDDGDPSVGDSETFDRIRSISGVKDFFKVFFCIWWMLGFYWLVSAEEHLVLYAPGLYWLTMGYLALEMFFSIIFVLFACLLGFGACCCFPCIIALMYIIAGQEGASEADISVLSKFRFEVSSDEEQPVVGAGRMVPIERNDQDASIGRVLLEEDADCCICLSAYEDGAELLLLPCNHHFHDACIVKWLKMNATCPLCKFNVKRTEHVV